MADGKRPGGLTALAVLNFVLGGIGAIGLIFLFAILQKIETASGGELSKEMANQPGYGLAMLNLLLSLATVVLLIAAGVGYLGQKRVMGRILGNGYGIASLASSAVGVAAGGFSIFTLVFIIYPILTLALLNTTFKDDLVN